MTICNDKDCNKQASFNIRGKNPNYCGDHKIEGMVNVKNKTCLKCEKIPAFNIRGSKCGIYCGDHKLAGMVDIRNKTCMKCDKQPAFNIRGSKCGIYCGHHKLTGMVDVKHKTCMKCDKIPYFNIRGEKCGIYCVDHKTEEMIDVKNKRCYLCDIQIKNKAYRGYCVRCFINTFPTETVARNHKTKERNVVDCIKQVFPDLDWKEDRKISCGCSKRRPDLFLDLATRVIVAEIDENQHTDYNSTCETKRMMEIYQDAGERPIVFIRFNPDKYTNGNVKITSCWGIDGNGMTVVKKCKIKEWKDRTDTLNNQIQYCIDNPSDKMIDVVHLFYDV